MKAVALFSGGLDSMIAIKLITEQKIDVVALYIKTGFDNVKDIIETLKTRAELLEAEFKSIDIREEYLQKILFNPKYGYGKNFNPCIDCHGYMFKVAKAIMKELNCSFIITGEVVGQRPMSQKIDALKRVTLLADDRDDKLIVRPLSAKLLEPTTPEINGWINRDELLDISGRNREKQILLAKKYGWKEYNSPAGGCLLTEAHYSNRVREFIKYDKFEVSDIDLLKSGRHFRLPNGAKLVVGRNQEDNGRLRAIQSNKYIDITLPIAGSFSLIDRNATNSDRKLAAKIAITYAKSSTDKVYRVKVGSDILNVSPFTTKEEVQRYFFNVVV